MDLVPSNSGSKCLSYFSTGKRELLREKEFLLAHGSRGWKPWQQGSLKQPGQWWKWTQQASTPLYSLGSLPRERPLPQFRWLFSLELMWGRSYPTGMSGCLSPGARGFVRLQFTGTLRVGNGSPGTYLMGEVSMCELHLWWVISILAR